MDILCIWIKPYTLDFNLFFAIFNKKIVIKHIPYLVFYLVKKHRNSFYL